VAIDSTRRNQKNVMLEFCCKIEYITQYAIGRVP